MPSLGPPVLCLVVAADAGLLPARNGEKGAAFEVCLEHNSLAVSASLPLSCGLTYGGRRVQH